MENIILLMCGKDKQVYKRQARYLYTSKRFQKSLHYAKTLANEKYIYILSAKYGLVELEMEIEPYDKSLYDMSITEKEKWAKEVISKLRTKVDVDKCNFIFLTDNSYSEHVCKHLPYFELPLEGLTQEKHLSWYLEMLNEKGE
jgi:hypothetical protein